MASFPEHERQSKVVAGTQAAGEFADWLASEGIHLMTWREDLSDTRPTDPECKLRRRGQPAIPCDPDSADGDSAGVSAYWVMHCKHWHDPKRAADRDGDNPGACCRCGKGSSYEIHGLRAWVSPSRDLLQLLADWAGIDLAKIEAEKRQMLEQIRAANEAVTRG